MWDARTGTPLLELKGHTGFVTSVCFSADGTRVITGSSDRTARVWDGRSGQPLQGGQPPGAEERDYRLFHTRPDDRLYADGYDAARQANDPFAARFYLDRLIEVSAATDRPAEAARWRAERARYTPPPERGPRPREVK